MKGAEGGEEKIDCPKVVLLRLEGERGQGRKIDKETLRSGEVVILVGFQVCLC